MFRTTRADATTALAVTTAMTALTALAGCSGGQTASGGPAARSATPSASQTPAASSTTARPRSAPATVTVTPADRARGIEPGAPVKVAASGGTVTDVVVTDDKGAKVPGTVKDGVWTPAGRLGLDSAYSVRSVVTLADGR